MPRDRDSGATKARLLGAATSEFAAYGIAGARVDRIAAAAKVNKQLIYAYFGSKDGLFEAVVTQNLATLTEQVPFDAEDLADYSARLLDHLLRHPEVMRLVMWAGLERPTEVPAFEAEAYRTNLTALAEAQRAGRVDGSLAPADLLAVLLGVTGAWFYASEGVRRFDSRNPWSPKRLAQFRSAAAEATTRILAGPPVPPTG